MIGDALSVFLNSLAHAEIDRPQINRSTRSSLLATIPDTIYNPLGTTLIPWIVNVEGRLA